MRPTRRPARFLLFLAFLAGGSCSAPDPGKVREKEARTYAFQISAPPKERVRRDEPLSLQDCLRIALERSFLLRKARLQEEVARLGAQALSRSLLLPRVDVSLVHMDRSNKPLVEAPFAGTRVRFPMMDKRVRVVKAQASLPLLDLSRWFLSAQARRGAEIRRYMEAAVRQGVQAEVTLRYGALAALEAALPAVEARVRADRVRLGDLEGLVQEGLALPQARQRAALALETSRDRLARLRREIDRARRELEQALGLPPAGRIRILPDFQVEPPEGGLEELVLFALEHRPELFASDRAVLLKKAKARAALAAFLPGLLLNVGAQLTTDSAQVHQFWLFGGLTAFVNLLDGFAKPLRLKGARREVRLARVERRELYGTVILQVVRAWQDLQDAREAEARALRAFQTARDEAERGRRLHREGLLGSGALAALEAGREGALAALRGARIRRKSAAALLRLALGAFPAGGKEEKGREDKEMKS